MQNKDKRWEILNKSNGEDIIDILLENRTLKTKKEKEEFLNPTHPEKIGIKELGIAGKSLEKTINRIKKAIESKDKIIIYGDYDADGVCAAAILWECLFKLNKNTLPYLPDRFTEGYGINSESVQKVKAENPNVKLIITVDNGIVAADAVDSANNLGIDVIVTDHHVKGDKLPNAHSIVHTTKIGGAGLAWILAREIRKKIQSPRNKNQNEYGLELAGIGTIADQLPLLGSNRSFAKYGLTALNTTKRPGLLALYDEAGMVKVGTYEVNYIIAPRLNAMGRLEHAIDSLRLLCTTNKVRARELAKHLTQVNSLRQEVLEKVVVHAKDLASKKPLQGVILVSHESYHEGVIGLAASKLVEEFYRPVVVVSRGKKVSKASARSIPGFNIIEVIRKLDSLITGGGGHPMAAGFTIETEKIEVFSQRLTEISSSLLTDELLSKRLSIDMEIDFSQINNNLLERLSEFEPTGIGNPRPTFMSKKVKVQDARVVGTNSQHLKLKLNQEGTIFNAIAFGMGSYYPNLSIDKKVDLVYSIEENVWNGNRNLELKVKDLRIRI